MASKELAQKAKEDEENAWRNLKPNRMKSGGEEAGGDNGGMKAIEGVEEGVGSGGSAGGAMMMTTGAVKAAAAPPKKTTTTTTLLAEETGISVEFVDGGRWRGR
jgi:hypothetical protein